MIEKAVIPAAGLGTRLLPATKEQPKEMLPVFAPALDGGVCVKPIMQLVFEQLYDIGLREFCIVIGRGKRAIEDHFTQDYNHTKYLRARHHGSAADQLEAFYQRLDDSDLSWVTQPEPRGFGDCVLRAHRAIGDKDFALYAGDGYIVSGEACVKRLISIFEGNHSGATLLIAEYADPRNKGVAEVRPLGENSFEVLSVEEKPERPKTNLGIGPIYILHPRLFHMLEKTKPGKGGEIQLTDAIQMILSEGSKVHAGRLLSNETRLDVGDPASYWDALQASWHLAKASADNNY